MKLIRLINGAWISPAAVTAIRIEAKFDHPLQRERLNVIVMHSGTAEVLPVPSALADPGIVADAIAAEINAALQGKPSPKEQLCGFPQRAGGKGRCTKRKGHAGSHRYKNLR